MPENKTGTEKKISILHCVQDGQKEGRKMSETFQETLIEFSNGSQASGEVHPFVESPEGSRESKSSVSRKTFTVDPVFNIQNDRIETVES